jgi:hypothetical protein
MTGASMATAPNEQAVAVGVGAVRFGEDGNLAGAGGEAVTEKRIGGQRIGVEEHAFAAAAAHIDGRNFQLRELS